MAADSPVDALTAGVVYAATLRQLEGLNEADSALGSVALHLAACLDGGAGATTAQVAKELRTTLKELTPRDGGDAFSDFLASLDAEVRDAPPA